MKSILYTSEKTLNRNRRFGAANYYYPLRVVRANGTVVNALLTDAELNTIISRGLANGEDFAAIHADTRAERRSLWATVLLLGVSAAATIAVIAGVVLWRA